MCHRSLPVLRRSSRERGGYRLRRNPVRRAGESLGSRASAR
ncbi:hypothetical protein FM112_11100 [Gulosibacter sp. 10]|nr:hypothetical protein FM112_11100 [Gulosibacter sp. 10]